MRRAIIFDTTAVYALTTQPDRHYAQATQFWGEWLKSGGQARHGADVAITAGRKLRDSKVYQWTPLTPGDELETWAVFQKYADKEWSFVDCGLFVLARRLTLPVFSFDHHFEQMPEVQRVP